MEGTFPGEDINKTLTEFHISNDILNSHESFVILMIHTHLSDLRLFELIQVPFIPWPGAHEDSAKGTEVLVKEVVNKPPPKRFDF